MKDLPHLALLGQTGTFDAEALRNAIRQTFTFRKTHSLPVRLPSPPPNWAPIYSRMAAEDDLPWSTLEALEHAARAFVDPLLDNVDGFWNPPGFGERRRVNASGGRSKGIGQWQPPRAARCGLSWLFVNASEPAERVALLNLQLVLLERA